MVTVNGVNDAPVLDLSLRDTSTNDRTVNYTEGDGNVRLAPHGTVTDVDLSDFDGGSLTVEITANGDLSQDRLSIKDGGIDNDTGATNPITLNGGTVLYNGTVIGAFTGGGDSGQPLVVTFTTTDATQMQSRRWSSISVTTMCR